MRGGVGVSVVRKKAKRGVAFLLHRIIKAFKAFFTNRDLLPALCNAGSRFP